MSAPTSAIMTGRASVLNSNVAPLVVFPLLAAVAARCLFIGGVNKSLASLIDPQCIADAPLRLQYTGLDTLDMVLCNFVAFFHAGLQPDSKNYTIHLAFNLAPIVVFMYVEGTRAGRHRGLSSLAAAAWSLIYQIFTAGVVLPLYWASFVRSGQATRPGGVDAAHAQASAFAFLAAYFVLTTLMLAWVDPHVTAIWQAFPLWILIAQRFHLLVRPSSRVGPTVSGKRIAQALYGLTFLAAALSHLTLVWPIRNDTAALRRALIPRFLGADEKVGLTDGARNFFQWDGMLFALEAMIATLWFARSAREMLFLILWHASTTVTMGPGAALSAVFAWREEWIDEPMVARLTEKANQKL